MLNWGKLPIANGTRNERERSWGSSTLAMPQSMTSANVASTPRVRRFVFVAQLVSESQNRCAFIFHPFFNGQFSCPQFYVSTFCSIISRGDDHLVGALQHFGFSHLLGIGIIPADFHIFQRGRLNHQPAMVFGDDHGIHSLSLEPKVTAGASAAKDPAAGGHRQGFCARSENVRVSCGST